MQEDSKFWRFLGRYTPWLGTPGLLKAIVMLNALTFVLISIDPAYEYVLMLDPDKIRSGQIWRLVTYIFVPEVTGIWVIFALLFLWFIASALEEIWGSLRLNAFYLVGMIGCTVAAFFFGGGSSNTFLNLSLFFAFATVAPDYEIFLFFIVRMKIKYLAWVLAVLFLVQFLAMPLGSKMAIAASLVNYFLFFGPTLVGVRHVRRLAEAKSLREAHAASQEFALHTCTSCGRTELTHPDLQFRVVASGDEFCLEHLPPR